MALCVGVYKGNILETPNFEKKKRVDGRLQRSLKSTKPSKADLMTV